jgi:hypothetical protein
MLRVQEHQPNNTTGYVMIQTLEIDNFRGFKSLKVDGLKRFNIVVGPNGSGKTALLEAIFLAVGRGPEVTLRFKRWRGLAGDAVQLPDTALESLWGDLFWNEVNEIMIALQDSEYEKISCHIYHETRGASITLPFGQETNGGAIGSSFKLPLLFEWVRGGQTFTGSIEVNPREKSLNLTTIQVGPFESVFLGAGTVHDPTEIARWYSLQSRANKEHKILAAMRKVYPFIDGLSIETPDGTGALLHATVHGSQKKIPVPLLSGGINKYLVSLLAISFTPRGIVLIDEVENGFYYDTAENIWSGLVTEAIENQTQLFMTTHSMEWLQSLSPTLKEHADEFCLLRAARREDGTCNVTRIEGHGIVAALQEGFEVR